MINIYFYFLIKYLRVCMVYIGGFYIRFNRSIYNRFSSMCSCNLTNHNLAKYSNMYVQIEIVCSLNYPDQSMIRIKLLKIETLVFIPHKTLTKTILATIEISFFTHDKCLLLLINKIPLFLRYIYWWILY